jgi:hypothetical protein
VRAELLAPLTDADSPLRDAGLQDIQEDGPIPTLICL